MVKKYNILYIILLKQQECLIIDYIKHKITN